WRGLKAVAAGRDAGPWTLVVLDVDNFKAINSAVGHDGGDRGLAHVAGILAVAAGDDGFAARPGGGDGLALLWPTDTRTASVCLTPLCDRIRRPIDVKRRYLTVSVSCGLAELGDHEDLVDAFARADRAMFKSKRAGGGIAAIAMPHR